MTDEPLELGEADRIAARPTCRWVESGYAEESVWNTECGRVIVMIGGAPQENDMCYCCYCGAVLVEVPYIEETP